jgi:hypothetical protein
MTQSNPAPQMHSPQRPGQMTATMRAVSAAAGPKVLRIGLVQGGKVIEERVIKQRTHVTVGPSEKATFVLPTKTLPPTFRLFELVGQDYCLNFIDSMTLRVALKTGISDHNALKGQARRVQQGPVQAFQIPLNEDARGKVVIGETTFLFQFVTPPPVQPRPQLPVSVRSGVEVDWSITVIAAFSFLLHFLGFGGVYSDWMDPVVTDDLDISQIIDNVKRLPPPPQQEQKEENVTEATTATAAAATAEAAAPKPSPGQKSQGAGAPGKAGGISEARAQQISNELASLDVAMLATLNSQGASTDRVLSGSDVPFDQLNKAAADGASAGRGNVSGLNLGGPGGGSFTPGGGGGNGLQGLGNKGSGEGSPAAGSAKAVKGPTGNASIGGASVSGGSVANASSVVAGMAAGFRRCYNRGLQEDPNMKGSVRITAKIGPNGEVLSASPSGGGGLSGTVTGCVAARVSSAQFAPPDGGGATIVIPVSFQPQ